MFTSIFKIIDWIFGPGESYLSTSNKIGDSVKSCDYHKRAHDDFEATAGVSYYNAEADYGRGYGSCNPHPQ